MRTMSLSFLAAFLAIFGFGSCSGNQQSAADPQLETDSIEAPIVEGPADDEFPMEQLISGPFALGKPLPKAEQIEFAGKTYVVKCHTETEVSEGDEYEIQVAEVSFKGEILMRLQAYEDEIGDVYVVSPKVIAPYGLHVGSTIDDFLAKEPNTGLYFTYVCGRAWLELPNYDRLQFCVPEESCKSSAKRYDGDLTILKPSDFKPNTAVQKIRVF